MNSSFSLHFLYDFFTCISHSLSLSLFVLQSPVVTPKAATSATTTSTTTTSSNSDSLFDPLSTNDDEDDFGFKIIVPKPATPQQPVVKAAPPTTAAQPQQVQAVAAPKPTVVVAETSPSPATTAAASVSASAPLSSQGDLFGTTPSSTVPSLSKSAATGLVLPQNMEELAALQLILGLAPGSLQANAPQTSPSPSPSPFSDKIAEVKEAETVSSPLFEVKTDNEVKSVVEVAKADVVEEKKEKKEVEANTSTSTSVSTSTSNKQVASTLFADNEEDDLFTMPVTITAPPVITTVPSPSATEGTAVATNKEHLPESTAVPTTTSAATNIVPEVPKEPVVAEAQKTPGSISNHTTRSFFCCYF